MVEEQLYKEYTDEEAIAIQEAFMVISMSGIIERQLKLQLARVVEGAAGATDEELMEQIKRHRAESFGAMLVHHYGLQLTTQLKKGINNA